MRVARDMTDYGVTLVRDSQGIAKLAARLFGGRHAPCVVLTQPSERAESVLPLREVRAIAGADALIYLISDELLPEFRRTVGPRLALASGMARIFWPELTLQSDPFDHPLVTILDVELTESALAEFAAQFDLSRPHIRREINMLEALRATLSRENARLKADLRQCQRELGDRHQDLRDALARAEHAERQLRGPGRQP
jgi:hypothetical protein